MCYSGEKGAVAKGEVGGGRLDVQATVDAVGPDGAE